MEEINLKDFFIYLKNYIIAFIVAIVIVVGGVAIYDTQIKKPIYQAKTTVVIANSDEKNNATTTLNDVNMSQKLTTTYSEIAKSELVLGQVGDFFGKYFSNLVGDDCSLLGVAVLDRDAEDSSIVNWFDRDVFAEIFDISV